MHQKFWFKTINLKGNLVNLIDLISIANLAINLLIGLIKLKAGHLYKPDIFFCAPTLLHRSSLIRKNLFKQNICFSRPIIFIFITFSLQKNRKNGKLISHVAHYIGPGKLLVSFSSIKTFDSKDFSQYHFSKSFPVLVVHQLDIFTLK